jgi:hypothetical protein
METENGIVWTRWTQETAEAYNLEDLQSFRQLAASFAEREPNNPLAPYQLQDVKDLDAIIAGRQA